MGRRRNRDVSPPVDLYTIRYLGKPLPTRKLKVYTSKEVCLKTWKSLKFNKFVGFTFDNLEDALHRLADENSWHCWFDDPTATPPIVNGRYGLQLWKGRGKKAKMIAEVVPYKDPEHWEIYRVRFHTSPADTLKVYELVKSGKVRWWTD